MKKILLILKNLKTKVNIYYNKITSNKNKTWVQELGPKEVEPEIKNTPKKLSNEVISMVSELKNIDLNNEKTYENDINKFEGLTNLKEMTIQLQKFIEENRNGEKIPNSKQIMEFLNIDSEKLRKKLLGELMKKGVLIKLNVNTYGYNIDYQEVKES